MLTDVYNTKNETINKNNTSKKYNAGNGYCEDMEEVLLFLDLQNIQVLFISPLLIIMVILIFYLKLDSSLI